MIYKFNCKANQHKTDMPKLWVVYENFIKELQKSTS